MTGSLAALVLTQRKSQVPRGSSIRYLQPVPSQQAAPPGCGSSKSLSLAVLRGTSLAGTSSTKTYGAAAQSPVALAEALTASKV